ncbi:MAG: glycosyltransferase family 2 protein [Candidatus Kariarchaeaceae archaeon]
MVSEKSSGLVILFALNELPALKQLLKKKVPDNWSILIFDGKSTDGSQQWLTDNGVNWLEQQSSLGKGNAVREVISQIKNMNYSYYAFMDADCTCLFSDLPKLKTQITATCSDIVIGTRMKGYRESGSMNFISWIANHLASKVLSLRWLKKHSDVQSPFWLFKKNTLEHLQPYLKSQYFEIELEMYMEGMKNGLKIDEVPIHYRQRVGYSKFKLRYRLRNIYYVYYYFITSFNLHKGILILCFFLSLLAAFFIQLR